MKYILGIDPGVASIGWAVVEVDDNDIPKCITDHGVVLFDKVEDKDGKPRNLERRTKRGLRRVIRRRRERLRRIRNLLLNQFSITEDDFFKLFHEKGKKQNNNILELNVKGLTNKLNDEELIRVLVAYAKNRGFKSNRKVNRNNELGKMKSAISNIQEIMKENSCLVSEAVLLYQEKNNIPISHNDNDHYHYCYERADVEKEISSLLDKQIEFNVIDKDFKDKYINIWGSQRDYSEGPACGPYRVDIMKLFGKCKFRPQEYRVPKACPSYDFFVLVQKLQNIRYLVKDANSGEYIKEGKKIKEFALKKDEIEHLFSLSKECDVKYEDVLETVKSKRAPGVKVDIIKLPQIGKKEFRDLVKKYRKDNGIKDGQTLSDEQMREVNTLAQKIQLGKEVYKLNSYRKFKEKLKAIGHEDKIEDIDFLDIAGQILAFAKTDKKIEELFNNPKFKDELSPEEKEIIKKLDIDITGSGSLCLSLTKEVLDYMLDGYSYDDAMKELDFNHSDINYDKFKNGFPTVEEIEKIYHTEITNPSVKHTLVYMRKLYNAIVDKYGAPYSVHLEIPRDLSKSLKERRRIEEEQKDNYYDNEIAKIRMAESLGLNDIKNKHNRNFKYEDIMRFRLWEEQKHCCIYSDGEEAYIRPDQVLDGKSVHVDHILPFSRSFDDSYANKVLVFAEKNKDKKDKTPYEWFGKDKATWAAFKKKIENNPYLSQKKKNNLLNEDEITFDEFSSRSLNSTAYISRLLLQVFKNLFNSSNNDNKVIPFKGTATSYLRKYYGLNKYTHSIESPNYLLRDTKYIIDVKAIIGSINSKKDSAKIVAQASDKYGRVLSYEITVQCNKNHVFTASEQRIYDTLSKYKNDLIVFLKDCFDGKDIYEVEDFAILEKINKDVSSSQDKNRDIAILAYQMLSGLKSQLNEKNRDNHFHHEIDAILVAIMTRSMQMKITKFSKIVNNGSDGRYVDSESGEVFKSLRNLADKYNVSSLEKNEEFFIPQPYDNFIQELVYKVFERNEEVLNEKLTALFGVETKASVKYPSFQANKKVSGALHKESIYGVRDYNNEKVTVMRTDVRKLSKSGKMEEDAIKKALNNLYDKSGGQKAVYEALKKWLSLPENERKDSLPTICSNPPQYIKKVKMIQTSFDKVVQISKTCDQKGYAVIGGMARIQIYIKDGNLYFCPLSIEKYLLRKNGDLNFKVALWKDRNENNTVYLNYSDINESGFNLYRELYPGQNIFVLLRGNKGILSRVVTFSSGQFEIRSIIGDQLDLINSKIVGKWRKQDFLAISTIDDVVPIKIDILGNLCHTDSY